MAWSVTQIHDEISDDKLSDVVRLFRNSDL